MDSPTFSGALPPAQQSPAPRPSFKRRLNFSNDAENSPPIPNEDRYSTASPITPKLPKKLYVTPKIYTDYKTNKEMITLCDQLFEIKTCGQGTEKKVFRILDKPDQTLTFGKTSVKVENLVVKIVNPLKSSRFERQGIEKSWLMAHHHLVKEGLPRPVCYANWETLTPEELAQNGHIWIEDYLPTQVTTISDTWSDAEDLDQLSQAAKNLLDFIQSNFQKFSDKNCDYIGDFRPENVAQDKDGNFIIIDSSPGVTDEEEFIERWSWDLLEWSNGSRAVFNFITKDFSEKHKTDLNDHIKCYYKTANGVLPKEEKRRSSTHQTASKMA